jgi:hypothetical protein
MAEGRRPADTATARAFLQAVAIYFETTLLDSPDHAVLRRELSSFVRKGEAVFPEEVTAVAVEWIRGGQVEAPPLRTPAQATETQATPGPRRSAGSREAPRNVTTARYVRLQKPHPGGGCRRRRTLPKREKRKRLSTCVFKQASGRQRNKDRGLLGNERLLTTPFSNPFEHAVFVSSSPPHPAQPRLVDLVSSTTSRRIPIRNIGPTLACVVALRTI